MIIDLQKINEESEFLCDVCIVGAGAAGFALLAELLKSDLNIVVVEAGGLEPEKETQSLYDVEISGLPYTGATEGRFRILGGSTTQWGGQALPLTAFDFEKRDWVAHSGWPFGFDELGSYYERAKQFLLVDNKDYSTELFEYLHAKAPAFDSDNFSYHFSKWSPTPNLRENYIASIKSAKNCKLFLHANVTNINLEKSLNRIQAVKVQSLTGQQAVIKAKNFVIATGGIETARLLLSNTDQISSGIGNENDLVGRFFQDHPCSAIGWVKTDNPAKFQKFFNTFHKNGLRYSVRCSASRQWQRQYQTLNMSMAISFIDESLVFQDLKDFYRGFRSLKINLPLLRQLKRILSRPGSMVSPILHYLLWNRSYLPNARFRVDVFSEQEPNPESRLLLSQRKDALGIPLTDVRWKLTDLTQYSIRKYALALQKEFSQAKIGDIILEPWIENTALSATEQIKDLYHHMGATRMHESPSQGVVNRDCRLHGVDNLFIASSSVFPTGGHSNPTLTLIALCIRLADKLKKDMGCQLNNLQKQSKPVDVLSVTNN